MAKSKGGSGMSIFAVLFVIFLVLKLTKLITWSWWWVTAPIWGPFAIIIIIAIVIVIIFAVTHKHITLYKNQ